MRHGFTALMLVTAFGLTSSALAHEYVWAAAP